MSEEVTPTEPVEPATGDAVEVDEPLGEGGVKALKAEREARAAAEKLAAEREARLKEYEDRDKSEEEKTQERVAAAERRAVELELKAARAEVAATSGVPIEVLAGPKSGSAEDIQAYADSLIDWRGEVPVSKGPVIPGQGKAPEGTDVPVTPNDLLRAAFQK